MRKRHILLMALLLVTLMLSACGAQPPAVRPDGPTPTPLLEAQNLFSTPAPANPSAPDPGSPDSPGPGGNPSGIVVAAGEAGQPIDPRLLGTNVPAWMGVERLTSPVVQQHVKALGPAVLRLPGGSWSNYYDWLACENNDKTACDFPVAARPTEFLNFLRATGGEGMWTVSLNGTAKEAAALVAFFNGATNDETLIGIDVRGRDWKTVGHWARLRSANGNPEPLKISLWEVGNEIYGAKPSAGPNCAPWGWEDTWTCDGTEYVLGKTSGATRYEGYLEFRAAMRAVDPEILVGAVGVGAPDEWSAWGNKVIAAAGASLDFYSVHVYPFEGEGVQAERVLDRPQHLWGPMMRQIDAAFDRYGAGRRIPVAVTEYNLFAGVDQDAYGLQRRMVNAIFIVDSLGQMAEHGVAIANHWNLVNGITSTDSDYGLLHPDTGQPHAPYYAFVLWSRFGSTLLPVSSPFAPEHELSVYAGRDSTGALTLLAINKTGEPISTEVSFEGVSGTLSGTLDTITADGLEATEVRFNDVARPSPSFADAPSERIGPLEGPFEQTFAPFSISLLRLDVVE